MSQERTDNLFASESWTTVYTAFTNVSLKAYDFDTIRAALLEYTSKTYPDKFNDFIASSEFIAILDLVAYLGHSLAFRLDMNTRENFMDTAERRASILQMAKTLGYNKTRPINAKGFMKISSVTTTEDVLDNEGVTLAGKVINWNDSNNIDWYENFISILNSSFSGTTKIQNPTSKLTIADVEHSLYEINEDADTKNLNYSFTSNVGGKTRAFEAVRVKIDVASSKIYEDEPNLSNNFTIMNRNDNLGSASDRTGFFVFAVAGVLNSKDENYTTTISNRTQSIRDINISNSDVWIQKLDSQRDYVSSVVKVDNDTRETAIYNALRTGSGDLVSVNSIENNGIELQYPDGVFGNAATGGYRTWYRTVDNENFTVNANDITNQVITIPYTGSDNRTYRLTLTLTSTIDFTENYSGETYGSIRRTAPRSYYSQDRMVNAQDYNVYPLSLGTNVVRKVKAVNTSFAGNSRFYEMDDVLGHHSNLSVTGTDGSVFVEDEIIKIPLSYKKLQGNSDNFIRNELTKAIKHPSFLNSFFHKYQGDAKIKVATAKSYKVVTSNKMKITAETMTKNVFEGDYFELSSASGTTWAKVQTVDDTTKTYTLNKAIIEDGTIVNVVRGLRTKFTEAEINGDNGIKSKVDIGATFTLKYAIKTTTADEWEWQVHPSGTPTECHVVFNYSSGIRDNESEYVATFTGKKIAFESLDQVKFFYGNTTDVIDNETNLSTRDVIYQTYLTTGTSTPTSSDTEDAITIGQTPISDSTNYSTNGAEFFAKFQHTGARESYEYTESNDSMAPKYTHWLVSEDGTETQISSQGVWNSGITLLAPTTTEGKIIGDKVDGTAPNNFGIDKLKIRIDDLTGITSQGTSLVIGEKVVPSSETNLSIANITMNYDPFETHANATSAFATISSSDLLTFGFIGKPSIGYFNSAKGVDKWVFRDTEGGVDREQSDMLVTYPTTPDEYTFSLPFYDSDYTNQLNINTYDQDIKFKQYPFGEISVVSSTALTKSNIIIKTSSDVTIDTEHCTVTQVGSSTTYKIVFWTEDVAIDDEISVYSAIPLSNTTDIEDFFIRVRASFVLANTTTTTASTYKNISSYVYDDYLTDSGYKDNTKVKLFASDTTDHPYALYDITKNEKMVTESYTKDNVPYERTSKTAIAAGIVAPTTAGSFVIGTEYIIIAPGSTDFTLIGAANSTAGTIFEATGVGQDDGTARATNTPDSTVPATAENGWLWFNTDDNDWYERIVGKWKNTFSHTPTDGFVDAGEFVPGLIYEIISTGTTDFTLIGAADSNVGTIFTATGVGTGTGTAQHNYEITHNTIAYSVKEGITFVEDNFSSFRWEHYADVDKRIDPSTSNIVDMYVLSSDYVRNVEKWIANNFTTSIPVAPNNFELSKIMDTIEPKAAIADHVAYIPVEFKYLFGSYAETENQAVFKVIKRLGVGYTDSEIKTEVSKKVNEYFAIDNWDFGATFYFSELAAYLHKELGDYISSVVITPKYSSNEFTNLLSISCALNEIFMAVTTSNDVKIITQLAQSELKGE